MRARGLKLAELLKYVGATGSRPTRVRGLKHGNGGADGIPLHTTTHPTWPA